MTDEEWIDLGRRAVACRGWRWMPGMKINLEGIEAIGALRVASVSRCGAPITRDEYGRLTTWSNATLPDLRDPATVGCLLALVRERIPALAVYPPSAWDEAEEWSIEDRDGSLCIDEPTEAAALVAALESAP